MPKRKPEPVLTHTALLCLAYRALEADVRHWEEACSGRPGAAEAVANICAVQIAQMEAIRTMYRYETGVEM